MSKEKCCIKNCNEPSVAYIFPNGYCKKHYSRETYMLKCERMLNKNKEKTKRQHQNAKK